MRINVPKRLPEIHVQTALPWKDSPSNQRLFVFLLPSLNGVWLSVYAESESESRSVVSDSLWPHRLYSPWSSPGQNTGVGSLSLLQGIFPTQESNWGLLHYSWILYQLSYQGSPKDVFSACPWPRNLNSLLSLSGQAQKQKKPDKTPGLTSSRI